MPKFYTKQRELPSPIGELSSALHPAFPQFNQVSVLPISFLSHCGIGLRDMRGSLDRL